MYLALYAGSLQVQLDSVLSIRSTQVRHFSMARAGGFALISAGVAFVAVFSFLAMRFDYPAILDGAASDVLPALLATGGAGRFVWAVYGLLPLLLIVAGVGSLHALRHVAEGRMQVAMCFATLSAIAMMLGLLRWPSIHWELAQAFATANAEQRATISAIFDGLNAYLGNYIGEFVGELSFSIFFLLAATAMLDRRSGFPSWLAYLGLLTAVAGLIGMFRNATDAVDVIAQLNNYLLPLWMVVFGSALVRARPTAVAGVSPEHQEFAITGR